MKHLFKQGFTLIELLIVIAIVGILTALITTNLQAARARARDLRRKADLQSIAQSLRLYYNDAKRFPLGDTTTSFQIKGCNTISTPQNCAWGSAFMTTANTYMNSLPLDPSSSDSNPIEYQYESEDTDELLLVAQLENESDSDIAESQTRCSTLYGSFNGTKDPTKDYLVCAQ
jgi:prepilin-type N-terminal cleavage/methylation domain-containing protein